MKKLFLLALVAIFSCVSFAHAEISKEKRQEIEKMLKLTGVEKLADQMKSQMIAGMKMQMKDVPDSFWVKFSQKMDTHELIEMIIPVYDKYYTIDDLKAINAFYESPTGKKVLASLPQIMQESMQVGQQWGQKVSRQAAEEAQKETKGK